MTQLVQPGQPEPDPYRVPIFNASGEDIPPHACVQIAGATTVDDDTVFSVIKPTGTANAKFLINAPVAIESGGYGSATDFYPTTAAVLGLPVEGQEVGPIVNTWQLSVSGKSFLCLGGAAGGYARVAAIPPSAGQGADFPIIRIVNQSGFDRPSRTVFGIGTPIDVPPDSLPLQPWFASDAPVAGEPFAISLYQVAAGDTVDAAPVGVVAVQINHTDGSHTRADCITGDYAKLASNKDGPALILWRERELISGPSSLGLQWAFVLLDRAGAAATGGSTIATFESNSNIAAGEPNAPTQGMGAVWDIGEGGAATSLGTKTLWNPFRIEVSGVGTCSRITDDEYLIVGYVPTHACSSSTIVTDVRCVSGSIQVTKNNITYLSSPCQ